MIVVDTSTWVAYFRNDPTPAVATLRAIQKPNEIIVGDLVLLECLQGARDETHAAQMEAGLRSFVVEAMFGPHLAVEAARHYRTLRAIGVTPRKQSISSSPRSASRADIVCCIRTVTSIRWRSTWVC